MTLPKPLLWLPRSYVEREQQTLAQRQPESFLRVGLGYQEVLGAKPSWEGLIARLRQYSLAQVLGCLGRISGVLDCLERQHPEAQKRICDGLFGEQSAQVWKAVLEWRRRETDGGGPEATATLFHELQLISLAKVAFLTLEVGPPEGSPDLVHLAEALLMLNNLQEGVLGSHPGADTSTPEGIRVWHQHFIANGLFHHGDTDVHKFPRAYDLYLSDKPQLRNHPAYVDLPAAMRERTRLDPETLWFILFAFMAHWRTIEPEAIASGTWAMSRSGYFRNLNFSDEDTRRFFSLTCLDARAMKEQVEKHYREALKPFHVLPFARSPLVLMGDKVFCVSLKLLKHKLTDGLHHMLLDEDTFSRDRRGRYLIYMGAVFEDYVCRLLARAYPPSANRYIGPKQLAEAITGRSCDFAILYGDALVLLETKATRFSLAARTEESWSEYERQFNDIFVDGASQIDNTVNAIESGRLRPLEIDPAYVRLYFPLIVTLEDLPMFPAIYRKVREDVAKAGLLQQPKVRDLQAIDVGELEYLEIGLHFGRSLRDILQEKLASDGRDESMGNYLIGRREPFIMGPVNQYLGDLFHRLGDKAVEVFRTYKKGPPEEQG